ncbi:prolyl oligopeptidase family serine peptidase [Qipengyuania nanhaisediminis]|uniref:dipeptidyl-peptidase 5 n=1 Tax=Qipengyuania nanhaisediminis TaxID=604088 RepID=UPI0038B3D3E2
MTRRIIRSLAFAAIPALVFAPLSASAHDEAEPHGIQGLERPPMTARDLVTMPRLGGPTVTSDGRYAVYSVTRTDPETYDRKPEHYILDIAGQGSDPVRFDLGIRASSLSFGPDNFLYFLSSDHIGSDDDEAVERRSRLWRAALEADGNVTGPMLVADIEGGDIAGFALSPSGDAVALWGETGRDCASLFCEQNAEQIGSGRLYEGDGGFYRHWDRWIEPGKLNRVFVFDLEDGTITGDGVAADGGQPIGNTPTMPFGGSEDIAWAPDGSGLYFVAREADASEPTSTDLDIYWSNLSGAAPVNLTADNPAYDANPAPSPDGRSLAYVAMARAGYESDRTVIHLRDLASGEVRALTRDTDLSFHSLSWSADGRHILATAADVLDTPAFRIDPETGAVTELNLMAGAEAHIGNLTALAGDRLLFTRDSIGVPSELYLAHSSATARPLTDVVTSRMGEKATTVTTRFSFAGAEGDTVWGQITRLENQEGPIPAILYIHGGPQGSFRDGWSSRWNPRVLASQGYAVISVDFHGSAGYGQDFMDSINRDWGGKPLVDLQLGLDAALALDSQIDGTRACAMGASYGGYMVNWIAGNWPDRFNCLVQHDGLFDMRSFYYSTEELWFPRWDFGGSYSEAKETYERWNPVNYVENWRTPMLVIAGEQDFRVPYTQGLQSFTALQERGVPSQLLVFPDENHWVLGAKNSLQWHDTVFAWLDRWLTREDDAGE